VKLHPWSRTGSGRLMNSGSSTFRERSRELTWEEVTIPRYQREEHKGCVINVDFCMQSQSMRPKQVQMFPAAGT